MLCLKHVPSLLLLCGLARAFSMDESTDRSNSEVFPLVFNPFDVSHFKCLGYTLFENTVASSAYTYEVDVCFLAALATKLAAGTAPIQVSHLHGLESQHQRLHCW